MTVKLNIGLSRKIGEPNDGSRGASLHLEVELDDSVLQDATQLKERVRNLYELARQSLEEELHRDVEEIPQHHACPVNRIRGHAGHKPVRPELISHPHGCDSQSTDGEMRTARITHEQTNERAKGQANARGQRTVEVARASSGQIRAIFAITKRLGLDANAVIQERFRVYRMEDLTMREASSLIDDLQNNAVIRA